MIHVDRVARGFEASQSMKIEARDVHFLRHRRGIQAIQTTKHPFMHFRIDLRGSSLLPKIGESLAPEAPDHAVGSVSDWLTIVND
jgi:hypothetical protein